MSSIKLSPNASGTGEFTIAAPNSNTNRTLTLPDQTGTVLTNSGPISVNASAPAGAVTLDASGRLFVNATSTTETAQLFVSGSKTASSGIPINQLGVADSTALAAGIGGAINFIGTYTSGGLQTSFASIEASKDNGTSGDFGAAMVFKTRQNGGAQIERARIDSSGNLLVGTTSNAANYRVNIQQNGQVVNGIYCLSTAASSDGSILLTLGRSYAVNNTIPFVSCVDSAATRAEIRNNGGIANYQANNVNLSDRREKTNFAPAGDYLSKICAIPVQTFNYIDQNMEDDPGTTLGVVAQDVQAVAPELVMESNWGTEDNPKMRLSIYQTDLQYALMKCIQEQQAIITALTARIEALEAK